MHHYLLRSIVKSRLELNFICNLLHNFYLQGIRLQNRDVTHAIFMTALQYDTYSVWVIYIIINRINAAFQTNKLVPHTWSVDGAYSSKRVCSLS